MSTDPLNTHQDNDRLVALAQACGIADGYWNQSGQRIHPPAATYRKALASLGVLDSIDASDDMIADAHALQANRDWLSALPPVRVLYADDRHGSELVVAREEIHSRCSWHIETEAGSRIDGEFVPAELPLAGDHDASHRTIEGRTFERRWLDLPSLPLGYHRLNLGDGSSAELIVAPRRCHLPTDSTATDPDNTRVWGISVQLYALRSQSSWGIGDFCDLGLAIKTAAGLGARVIGINPLHALFMHEPEEASPYSPSSRLFLNPMYIAIQDMPEWTAAKASMPADLDDRLSRLQSESFINYSEVARLKRLALDAAFEIYMSDTTEAGRERREAFGHWRSAGGPALERFALFETLRERNAATSDVLTRSWQQWPESLQSPDSPGVSRIAREASEHMSFHAWLQWLAVTQLENVALQAAQQGMSIGLYRDLAVGIFGGGSDAWSDQALYVTDMQIGAPPDNFSANGQDWGLPPLDPRRLQEVGYLPFAQMLRENMRAAGAIRIDHVMGMMRLFWIPAGARPAEGIYVDYPVDDLIAVLALESVRARCIVIGEDLGTVPDGLRDKLRDAAVLSYRLMYFEKHYDGDQSFRRPDEYPALSLASANTHDLPTLRGFWAKTDLELRRTLELFPETGMYESQCEERIEDKRRLLKSLASENLLPESLARRIAGSGSAEGHRTLDDLPVDDIPMDNELVCAIHAWLARSSSLLMLANIEDLVGQVEQINLPGTDRDLYPNWRRRLALTIEDWADDAGLQMTVAAMNAVRPGPPGQTEPEETGNG